MPKPEDTLTMNKKVVDRFFLLKTHRASTSQLEISSLKHLFCRHFPLNSCPSRKASFDRVLRPPDCVGGKINNARTFTNLSTETLDREFLF